jgi:hypothetical protein
MHLRSHQAVRAWIACSIALVSMLAVVVSEAPAATLSGTIVDYSNYTHGAYHVYALRLNLTNPLVGSTSLANAGAWTISGVPNGNYFILAWRDVNGNYIPSRGEPMGYYGVPFPSRVTVQNGQNVSGLAVVMDATNIGAEIHGQVTYNGNWDGRVWVVAHTTPTLELTSVRGTPYTLVGPGEYLTYILDHGQYYVTAFMDRNGNLLRDADEPFGVVGPLDIVVTPGVTYTADIQLEDSGRTSPVESSTWSQVKELYQK